MIEKSKSILLNGIKGSKNISVNKIEENKDIFLKEYEIRAFYTDQTIRVYQAYCEEIAKEAINLGTFGSHFKMERMSWIKPSFLWMMYRCGWASKERQERVLAIDIKRSAFDYIVNNAVVSSFNKFVKLDVKNDKLSISKDMNSDNLYEEWRNKVRQSDIRCQWDPERDIYGNALDCRSIQLGLRGEALYKYVNEWIVKIEDITDYVKKLDDKKKNGIDILSELPTEKVYIPCIEKEQNDFE